MKQTYKTRLFFWFFIIIAIFTVVIIWVEQNEEKKFRTQALESELGKYTEIIHAFIEKDSLIPRQDIVELNTLVSLFPDKNIRVSIINKEGKVLYDNDSDISNIATLGNHLNRPEVMNALYKDFGTNIRMSESTDHKYLYYAKYYNQYFVRVALPYNIQLENVLRPDRMFIYISIGIFLLGLLLLNIIAGRFGKSIFHLKELASNIKDNKPLKHKTNFPDDELGEIGYQLNEIFKQKEENEQKLISERKKIVQHFQMSKTGLCIFNADYSKVYYNTIFMQYLNLIVDNLCTSTDVVFRNEKFAPIQSFLQERKPGGQNNFTYKISQGGRTFEVQTVIFDDESFEVGIKDISELEHTQRLKQEMTNNIAHELRTPVASLRGYLETLDGQSLPEDKQQQFIHRAHIQSVRLANIVNDISLITKMEEGADLFKLEKINLSQVINDVRIDLIDKLERHSISFNVDVSNAINIEGNYTLLYSIFRNLIDNSIQYGGSDINIFISNYMKDDRYYYFSYYDTGKGVDEVHLARLFERFYRGDEGRTREQGGSGLGLSIVRNAIKFHHGEVQVKNRKDAGLEFLFTLKK